MWYNADMEGTELQARVAEVSEYLEKNKDGTVKVPVDLGVVLEKFNIKALNATFSSPEVSGAFDRRSKVVFVNKTDPQTTKIFTLAHELGHYFLHEQVERDILFREKNTAGITKENIEKEADAFAAALLMPESAIRKYWPIAESIQQMAEFFSVSYPAMLNRLRSLGFI